MSGALLYTPIRLHHVDSYNFAFSLVLYTGVKHHTSIQVLLICNVT